MVAIKAPMRNPLAWRRPSGRFVSEIAASSVWHRSDSGAMRSSVCRASTLLRMSKKHVAAAYVEGHTLIVSSNSASVDEQIACVCCDARGL
eukprot:scaffold161318_cov34-Tisochrysis_lutea.AAC.6